LLSDNAKLQEKIQQQIENNTDLSNKAKKLETQFANIQTIANQLETGIYCTINIAK